MSRGRAFVRLRRRLRRPSLVGLAVASLVLHLGIVALLGWLGETPWAPPPPAKLAEPLIVELPPAEPGRPLVRPETPPPPRPPAVAARPAPAARPRPPAATPPAPAPAPEPAPPPPAPVTPPPPPAVAPAPEPPPPPTVAQAPEPPPEPEPPPPAAPAPAPVPPRPSAPVLPPPPVVARGPEPAPAPATPTAPSPAPAPVAPPPPPIVARAPEAAVPAPPAPVAPAAPAPSPAPRAPEAAPSAPPAAPRATPPAPSGAPSGRAPESAPGPFAPSPGESTLGREQRFSLMRPPIEVPTLPRLPGGGTRPEGDGAGEAGREREGGPAIPLNKPPDEDYAEYFLKVKRAIEEKWSYPTEAARKGQSGQLVLEFVIKKDGHVSVEMTRSSGIAVLDRYAINAVRLASPYPPLPIRLGEALRISANFSYILDHGFRVFGLQ